jgi:hypothetical protein
MIGSSIAFFLIGGFHGPPIKFRLPLPRSPAAEFEAVDNGTVPLQGCASTNYQLPKTAGSLHAEADEVQVGAEFHRFSPLRSAVALSISPRSPP